MAIYVRGLGFTGMAVGSWFAAKLATMKPQKSSTSPAGRSLTRLTTWVLASALLLFQTFGFVHGVMHRSGPGATIRLAVKPSATFAATTANAGVGQAALPAGEGGLALLFSSHTSDSDCRLYDQASHGAAAPQVACLALPLLTPSLAVAAFQGEALARWAALFDARGPPLTC